GPSVGSSLMGSERFPADFAYPFRIANQHPCHRDAEPETSILVASCSGGTLTNSVKIPAANPPVRSDQNGRQLVPVDQVHNVLPRDAEKLRRFTGREQLVAVGVGNE